MDTKPETHISVSPPYPFPGQAAQPHYGQGAPGQPYVPLRPTTTVIYSSAPTPVLLSLDPVTVTCPHCGQQVMTVTQYENGLATYLAIGACICFLCILGCCLIPLCIDGLKDAVHYCPKCQHVIGRTSRL
ncbi:LITAF domain-containing protein-like [Paramacrobiotus metropolitanus]|uniref:LITAF domain-containing protein-like n=1 Tax=Paramacrobiotus metropolitanus TaxID=2943436 RepID=UPI002445D68B|nr:LITAF domain-containing protein-like [Paramacrobiotus metropolitanus]